jgi:hypothetical protein
VEAAMTPFLSLVEKIKDQASSMKPSLHQDIERFPMELVIDPLEMRDIKII